MKKILMMFALIAMFTLLTPVMANAGENIETLITNIEHVKKAQVLQYGKLCVVAIDTENVTTKSQYAQLKQQIAETVKKETDAEHIVVTNNVRVYREIEKINQMPEEEKQQHIEKLLDRLSRIPAPLPYLPTEMLPLPHILPEIEL